MGLLWVFFSQETFILLFFFLRKTDIYSKHGNWEYQVKQSCLKSCHMTTECHELGTWRMHRRKDILQSYNRLRLATRCLMKTFQASRKRGWLKKNWAQTWLKSTRTFLPITRQPLDMVLRLQGWRKPWGFWSFILKSSLVKESHCEHRESLAGFC